MTDEELERAEAADVTPPPNTDATAENERRQFEEPWEKDRRKQFQGIYHAAVAIVLFFYTGFFWWVFYLGGRDWHIGLMLVLPPTTIILTLMPILRHKNTIHEELLIPQIQYIVNLLKPFKDLFK